MSVFKDYPEMKNLFIDSMQGTRESNCFELITANAISPHPNFDKLSDGGKI